MKLIRLNNIIGEGDYKWQKCTITETQMQVI